MRPTLQSLSGRRGFFSLLLPLLTLVMGLFIYANDAVLQTNSPVYSAVGFALIYLGSLLPAALERQLPRLSFLVVAAAAACLIYLRVCLLYYESGDYTKHLSQWVDALRALPVREALSLSLGDYNTPYIYILCLLGRVHENALVSIKAVSCLGDLLLAFFVMKCVSLKTDDVRVRMTAYLLTLALPTVFLNSAYWAQCDSIYASLCVAMLYFALRDRGWLTVICWSLAFSFKLQAVFILPLLVLLLLCRKLRLRQLLAFPLVFMGMLLPALIAGRGLGDCLTIYYRQTQRFAALQYNAPTLWRLFGPVDFAHFEQVALFLTGFAVVLLLYLCGTLRDRFQPRHWIYLSYLFALMIPYLLPRMHDRYFYLADIFGLLLFFADKRLWYVPAVTVFGSLVSYMRYLTGTDIADQRFVSLAFLLLLIVVLRRFLTELWQPPAAAECTPEFYD